MELGRNQYRFKYFSSSALELRRIEIWRNLPVKYPSWEHSKPCRYPDQDKDSEDEITGRVQLGVVEQLGQLQEYIGAVVGEQDQGSTPVHSRQLVINSEEKLSSNTSSL